jgi:probable phosphoglycerate mutase
MCICKQLLCGKIENAMSRDERVVTIFLARHGESIFGEERLCGWSDVPLSDRGKEQAFNLAERIKGIRFSRIISSDRIRTIETAEIINRHYSLKIEIEPEIRELNYGLWEGKSRKEIEEEFPQEYKAWSLDNSIAPPGGESAIEVYERSRKAIEKIVRETCGGNILIVAHKSVNRLFICGLLGGDLRYYRRIGQDNCAVNIIKYYSDFPVIERINDTGVIYG